MRVLVVTEHDTKRVRPGSVSAIGFGRSLAGSDGQVSCLVLGHGIDAAAQDASAFEEVLVADAPALAHPVADRYAKVIADTVHGHQIDLVASASTTFA